MAESKWNSRSPKANSFGTSAKRSAVAPPTKKPARPSPEEEKRRDSLGCPIQALFWLEWGSSTAGQSISAPGCPIQALFWPEWGSSTAGQSVSARSEERRVGKERR